MKKGAGTLLRLLAPSGTAQKSRRGSPHAARPGFRSPGRGAGFMEPAFVPPDEGDQEAYIKERQEQREKAAYDPQAFLEPGGEK